LIATWKLRMPHATEESVGRLLESLAREAPHFSLPPATVAHSRHYMPELTGLGYHQTLVFDTFVALDPEDPVVAIWPGVTLGDSEEELLRDLLASLSYLGRAESWCRAFLMESPPKANCLPLGDLAGVPDTHEPTRVLIPLPQVSREVLFEVLMVDIGSLRQKERLMDPPGARWATYIRLRDCLDGSPRRTAPGRSSVARRRPAVVRFLMDARPLPSITRSLEMGELARRSALALYGRIHQGGRSEILSGKSEGGSPLTGHRHAFYLPCDEDGDGRLDHLTVVAPGGFDTGEVEALASLRRLNPGGGEREINLLLLGVGSLSDLVSRGPFGPAAVWRSVTPFVLTRHPKTFRDGRPKLSADGLQVDGPEDQLRREWLRRKEIDPALPDLCRVERRLAHEAGNRRIRWLEYERWRRRGGGRGISFGTGFRLEFSGDVAGPIALGYGCHFGLGLFLPEPRPVSRGG
jgi:CRISPR-associated protein Csb2